MQSIVQTKYQMYHSIIYKTTTNPHYSKIRYRHLSLVSQKSVKSQPCPNFQLPSEHSNLSQMHKIYMNIQNQSTTNKILFSKKLYTFVQKNQQVLNVIFFQFFGTMFFSYGVLTGMNGNFTYSHIMENTFASVWIPMVLFSMGVFAGRFSKSHFNPAITLAYVFKKDERIKISIMWCYFAAEFTGAIFGAGIAHSINNLTQRGAPWTHTFDQYRYVLYAFRGEIFGTFLLSFFRQMNTTISTRAWIQEFQSHMFVPMMLMCARQYSYRLQGLNPAFAIAFQLFYCAKNGEWGVWAYVWANFFGPFVGSLLATVFFQFVFKRFVLYYQKSKSLKKKYNFKQIQLPS